MAWDVIVRAARVSDTLKAELGATARQFQSEDEWLRGVRAHLVEIFEDPAEYVDSRRDVTRQIILGSGQNLK
jgi:hypothetical protein